MKKPDVTDAVETFRDELLDLDANEYFDSFGSSPSTTMLQKRLFLQFHEYFLYFVRLFFSLMRHTRAGALIFIPHGQKHAFLGDSSMNNSN